MRFFVFETFCIKEFFGLKVEIFFLLGGKLARHLSLGFFFKSVWERERWINNPWTYHTFRAQSNPDLVLNDMQDVVKLESAKLKIFLFLGTNIQICLNGAIASTREPPATG